MQDIIEKAVDYLMSKYKAKTILLYGSFASQTANN
jgi:predicted nucleotidyltransferase